MFAKSIRNVIKADMVTDRKVLTDGFSVFVAFGNEVNFFHFQTAHKIRVILNKHKCILIKKGYRIVISHSA